MLEGMLLFLRDEVAKPAIGHDADAYLPLLWTMFMFILACNLLGLLPSCGSPTAAFGATLALAGATLLTSIICGMVRFGPIGFWLHFLPHMELPGLIGVFIKPFILALEIVGMFIRIQCWASGYWPI